MPANRPSPLDVHPIRKVWHLKLLSDPDESQYVDGEIIIRSFASGGGVLQCFLGDRIILQIMSDYQESGASYHVRGDLEDIEWLLVYGDYGHRYLERGSYFQPWGQISFIRTLAEALTYFGEHFEGSGYGKDRVVKERTTSE